MKDSVECSDKGVSAKPAYKLQPRPGKASSSTEESCILSSDHDHCPLHHGHLKMCLFTNSWRTERVALTLLYAATKGVACG